MELGAVIIGLVFVTAGLFFVMKPFYAKSSLKSKRAGVDIKPDEAHLAALSALRDLDFDFRTGKVSDEDYPALRAQLVAEAAKYVDREKEQEDKIESLIRARKAESANEKVCSECGETIGSDVHFCPHCGAKTGATCPSCGGTIKAKDVFCTSCGVRLQVPAEATA